MKSFVLALFLLLLPAALDVRTTKANPQTVYGFFYVPTEWGEFKDGNQQSGLAFQDRSGTLRFVTNLPYDSTPQPALEIRRTPAKAN